MYRMLRVWPKQATRSIYGIPKKYGCYPLGGLIVMASNITGGPSMVALDDWTHSVHLQWLHPNSSKLDIIACHKFDT